MGDYEQEHEQCDEYPEGETEDDKKACTWRDQCAALQQHCSATDKEASEFVVEKSKGDEEWTEPKGDPKLFMKQCSRLIKEFNIVGGRVVKAAAKVASTKKAKQAKEDGRKNIKPTKKAKDAARKALAARKLDRRGQLRELFGFFKGAIAEQLGGEYEYAPPKEAVVPGQLLIVDRIEKSGYVSIYCKTANGRDVPIVLARFKPRSLTMDVELPVEADEFDGVGKGTLKKLAPREFNDGMFRSIMMGLDREGCALVAETIGTLVNKGKIELPEA